MDKEHALNEEDLKLVNAIVQRDKKLFEVFYKKYYQQLFAVAYRYVKQPGNCRRNST